MSDKLMFSMILDKIDALESKLRPEIPAWLSVKQVAEYLGLSSSSIRKMVASGQIPYKRLPTAEGGAIRFNRRQIDLWLLSGELRPSKRSRSTFAEFIDD
ncbi:MAG: helix-turn-helix domain-containing protein [Candidatus Marinimicrobia bacterium]|nr:helix-turn-helix domain-containing protein [Candidatus Neomarinimicrobiota bacterium]MDD5539790.1 helix-turn-helix domain-containing protein [Candidatus Neomarinimicrobiota bacterium]